MASATMTPTSAPTYALEVEVALHHPQAKTASPLVPLRAEATHTLSTDAHPH